MSLCPVCEVFSCPAVSDDKNIPASCSADCELCSVTRGQNVQFPDPWNVQNQELSPEQRAERSIRGLFLSSTVSCVSHHAEHLKNAKATYLRELNALLDNAVSISVPSKAHCLAAAWGLGERAIFDDLLGEPGFADIHVLERCVAILDAARSIKQANKKLILASLQQSVHRGKLPSDALTAARACKGLGSAAASLGVFRAQGAAAGSKAPSKPISTDMLKEALGASPAALGALLQRLDAETDPAARMQPPSATYTATARSRNHTAVDLCKTHKLNGVTNALSKRVRGWFRSLSAESLEYLLLTCEPEALKAWRHVMDCTHAKPDDFALPFFPAVVFCGRQHVPLDHMVHMCHGEQLNAGTLPALCSSFPRLAKAYALVHKAVPPSQMSDTSKAWFATHAPLSDVIWWYEELHCPAAEAALMGRLSEPDADLSDGQYDISFGKLMERFMVFRTMGASFAPLLAGRAESALQSLVAHHPGTGLRVAILGDASGSMEVAVRTAAILGGLLSSVMHARLEFFDAGMRPQGLQPKTAAEVLDVATGTPAEGTTNPAAALQAFVDAGEPVDLFILVTDEGENGTSRGSSFAQLMKQYKRNVHAGAQVFFISFLPPTVTVGPMQVALAQVGIGAHNFKLDLQRPDLSKFSGLLGKLNSLGKEIGDSWGGSAPAAKAAGATPPPAGGGKQHPDAPTAGAAAAPMGDVFSDTFGAATLRRGGFPIGAPASARPAAAGGGVGGAPAAGAQGGSGGGATAHDDDVGLQETGADGGVDSEDPCGAPESGGGSGLGEATPSAPAAAGGGADVAALLARMAALEAENARLKGNKQG